MSLRVSTSVIQKERQSLQLDDFKGVDFSSSPLKVQTNRATEMSNFINEYGVNKKRNGWNELIRIKHNGVNQKINGIYSFQIDGEDIILVHAGKRFYKLNYNSTSKEYSAVDITSSSTYTNASVDITRLKDTRSQMFLADGKAYFIGCGDFLVYGKYSGSLQLRRVYNNEDTYIPTTSISIDNDAATTDTNRAVLDNVNVLTNKRKNQMLGVSTANTTFTVDSGSIDADTTVNILLETLENNLPVEVNITNSGDDKTKLYNESNTQVGTINFETGQITFSIATTPQIEERDNIYVTFEHTVEGYEDRITNCSFGVLFGTDGGSNRLFLSGNPDKPNFDFYSELEDFTYFTDLNYTKLGSDSFKIVGYSRLSDSTLAIFKEDNTQEATVYFRTGKDNYSYDSNGNIIGMTTLFPTQAGSIGEGVISRFASANLSGDVLILSANGVYGIKIGDNVSTTERYALERSRYINEKLKGQNLSEAVAIVYKNRYYLSVDDVCYIADARFTSQAEGDMGDTFNYEWWYWTNIPARVFTILDDQLCFGTKDGQICVFDNDYADRSYQNTSAGQLSLNIANNGILYGNLGLELQVNDKIRFTTSGLYELVLNNSDSAAGVPYIRGVAEDKITVHENDIGLFWNGQEVYADNVGSSGLSVNKKYFIYDLDYENCCFKLKDASDNQATINSTGFRLSRALIGLEMFIADVSGSIFKLKHTIDGRIVTLIKYNNSVPSNLLASIILRRNVVAEWYSPVFDFGTNMYSKTLLSLTISTDPSTNGKLEFGYETKNLDKMHQARGMNTFSFDNLDFNNFSFMSAFANSYTKKVLVRNFNYIMFKFRSSNDTNCIINNLTIVYKINKLNKGVK